MFLLFHDRHIHEHKKYGKDNVLNELEHKTISNAFRKAREESRWQQAKVFSDENADWKEQQNELGVVGIRIELM